MLLVKNVKFVPSSFFFKIGLAILFDVLDRKQGFLDNKNNFLRKSKILHIRKVLNPLFWKKIEISSMFVFLYESVNILFAYGLR